MGGWGKVAPADPVQVARPLSPFSGAEIRTSHPSGSRRGKATTCFPSCAATISPVHRRQLLLCNLSQWPGGPSRSSPTGSSTRASTRRTSYFPRNPEQTGGSAGAWRRCFHDEGSRPVPQGRIPALRGQTPVAGGRRPVVCGQTSVVRGRSRGLRGRRSVDEGWSPASGG